MPDITKCSGHNCPLKETCWRFTSPASDYYQSYFMSPPYDKEKEECEYQWLIKPKKQIKDESNT